MQFDTLFNPRSVAIIGASDDPTKVGYALTKNVIAGGAREVYPITLGAAQVMDHAAYPSISMVGGEVELAIIAVRADHVAAILRECADKGVRTAIVISAGFKELGADGARMEEELAAIANERSITLLGPNCLGVMNAQADWNASFAVDKPLPGHIACVSQSGALGTALLDWANGEGVGLSKFVSLGNEAALSETEFLEYLANDPETSAVLLYVEQISHGDRFLAAVRALTEKKPLAVLRAGRSSRGAAAVASHTGSLAPSDAVFGAALRQAGALPVDSIRELFSVAKLFALHITQPLTHLAILTNGGGPSVNTADLVDLSHSLSLAEFDDATRDALKKDLPPMAAVGNPVDVIGDAGPNRFDAALTTIETLSSVDAIITIVTPQMMTDPVGTATVLAAHRDKKPIIPVLMGGATMAPGNALLHAHGMVSFDIPSDAVLALDTLARGAPRPHTSSDVPAAPHAPSLALMHHEDACKLLYDYDMPLEGTLVTDPGDLEKAVRKLGDGPYALKVISTDLIHKSDAHAVAVNVPDHEALRGAWSSLADNVRSALPDAHLDGMLLQRMVSGIECIIGMKRDHTFGPVIVFGLGGIYVEVFKDASMRVAPVTKDEAIAQIHDIKGLPLLTGVRGARPVDIDELARVIVALSDLALEYPEIEEIDLNPVMATPEGIHIVDARIMSRP